MVRRVGNALSDLDDLAGAEAHYRTALSLDPTLIEEALGNHRQSGGMDVVAFPAAEDTELSL